jgi:hypothetical protein
MKRTYWADPGVKNADSFHGGVYTGVEKQVGSTEGASDAVHSEVKCAKANSGSAKCKTNSV